MKITLIEPLNVSPETIERLSSKLKEEGHTFKAYETLWKDEEEQSERIADSDIVMLANHPLSASVIHKAENLKMVDVAFTGIDHIAADACRERSITICNAAGYSTETVAELVLGMTVGALRNMTKANETVRRGGTSAGLGGREIAGKTVGIIGLGAIGTRCAELFLAFGAKVIAFSRTHRPKAAELGTYGIFMAQYVLNNSPIPDFYINQFNSFLYARLFFFL